MEDDDPDYVPDETILKPPPESIAVQEKNDLSGKVKDVLDCIEEIGVCNAPDYVPDGTNLKSPPECFAVTNFNMNDAHKNLDYSSTFAFLAIKYSSKIGGIGK